MQINVTIYEKVSMTTMNEQWMKRLKLISTDYSQTNTLHQFSATATILSVRFT